VLFWLTVLDDTPEAEYETEISGLLELEGVREFDLVEEAIIDGDGVASSESVIVGRKERVPENDGVDVEGIVVDGVGVRTRVGVGN
jgi:hypothetical protein